MMGIGVSSFDDLGRGRAVDHPRSVGGAGTQNRGAPRSRERTPRLEKSGGQRAT